MEQEIIDRIEAEAKRRNISVSYLCFQAVNDGKLIKRLKNGGTVTLPTLKRLNEWLPPPEPQGEGASK